MRRYPGNHTDSELLSVPRFLKTRPGAPQTHLAYITDSEANLLQENKPGTPHGGPHGIPNYDSYEYQTAREEQQAYARETGQKRHQAARSLGTQGHGGPRNVQEQQQEREFDRQTQIQENIRDEQQRKAQEKRDIINKQKQAKVQASIDLANKLRSEGKQAGDLTPDQKDALRELQYMQDEGVYGGVSGYEAEVNKMKKAIAEGTAGYKDSLAGLTRLSGGNEELAKISALGVQEYLRRKTKGNYQQQEDILSGKTQIEGLSPDFFKTFTGQTAGVGTAYYDKNTGKVVKEGDPNAQLGLWGNAMGYDPSGQFSWSQIQDDPTLYDKYLNRGNLWDDPYSGLFPASQKTLGIGGGGGGGGGGAWGSDGGGGGGGGGGGYAPRERPQFPGQAGEQWGAQNPLQQMMINIHGGQGFQQGFRRGGIVSLVA